MQFHAWIAFGLILSAACHAGQDWPRWRGPANDGHLPRGAANLTALPQEPKVLWSVPAGEGLASPVVANGRVLAFDNQGGQETLRALDANTGAQLWAVAVGEPFSDTQGPTGPRNTPLIDGERVYAVTCRGQLDCRKFSDGSPLWRAHYVKDFEAVFIGERGSAPGASRHGNDGSPLVDGPHLLACVGGTNGAGVVCFDKATGAVVWKSTSDQAGYAPPVVATLHGRVQVVCYTAAGVVGLDRQSGELLWRVPVKTSFARHVTTPIVDNDFVWVSSHEAGLLGIAVGKDGDAWTAEVRWKSKEAAINYSSPVAVGGHLFGVGPARDLVCVDMKSGALRWSQKDAFTTAAGKCYAGLIAMGPRILMLTDGGEVRLFDATPEAYRELGRAQACGVNWCNPAYSEGVLYLRDGITASGGNWKAVRLQ
ncbi:MAG: PQQ-like beta-propeller repeat protein [Verrucomicrobiales bacterium]|nr:PQQ-like beta-propeller repeat protein [Verrucomicrobiales bacterium]